MRRVAIVLVALTVVLAALISIRLWTQARALAAPAGGSGEIEGVVVDLSSRVGARLLQVKVREGDAVRKGDLLVVLDCADPAAALAEAEARLAAAQAQAAAALAQRESAGRNRAAAGAAREAATAQAEGLVAQRDAAERQAQRLEAVSADVPASSVDQTRAGATGLARQAEAARAQAAAGEAQVKAAEGAVHAAGAQAEAAAAQVKAAEASAARARILAGECELRAPRDAEVSKLPHEAGELAAAGTTLVRLVDLSEPKATFYLPNAEVGAVKPGARATVVADAWPGESFEGTVRTVAVEAEFTPRNIVTRTDRDRLVYPVEVTVKNRDGKLRAGMPVQVQLEKPGRAP
jgi:HlyD family secretion protein